MENVIVRYKLKADRVEENEEFVRKVYEQLKETAPKDFNYATFKLEDGLSFMHIAQNNTGGKTPLSSLPAFKDFQLAVKDRCDELPVVSHVTEIGHYTAF